MPKIAAALALALAAASTRAQAPGPAAGGPPLTPGAAAPAPAEPSTAASAPARTTGARAEPPAAKAPVPRGAVLEEVSGVVRELDRKGHKLTVEGVTGPVTLSLDRNTMVYTAAGLGTVLDLAPGQQIRAGRNADFLAYWVQLRLPAQPEPASGRGTGAAPAGAPGGKDAGPATSPPAGSPAPAPASPAPKGGTPPGK